MSKKGRRRVLEDILRLLEETNINLSECLVSGIVSHVITVERMYGGILGLQSMVSWRNSTDSGSYDEENKTKTTRCEGDKTEMRSCLECGLRSCEKRNEDYPEFCLTRELDPDTIAKVRALYEEEENRRVSVTSAEIEDEFYLRYTRVEETVEFARRMGFHKIGIATCVGLIEESRTLARILRKKGFEVYGAVCKVGSFDKTGVGVAEDHITKTGPVMCNPILQAELLNREGTEFNIVMGLCVGHDSLFYKYSEALATTLVAKDRVLAHNPAGALYQVNGYYKKLMGK